MTKHHNAAAFPCQKPSKRLRKNPPPKSLCAVTCGPRQCYPGARARLEVAWQPRGELLRVLRDLVVEVDGRRVLQAVVLRVDRRHDARVAVTDAHCHNARKRLTAHALGAASILR